jgi:flagellar secretion chaperone FliS
MLQNAHDAYFESRILAADPLELVKMMYQASIAAVRDARRHLANRDIAARARAITKANTILTELTISLDHARGGELSQRLAGLYDYMNRLLIEANLKQADEPLAEVLGLLTTLAEGWEGIGAEAAPKTGTESPRPQPLAEAHESPRVPSVPRAAHNPWAQPLPEATLPDAPPPEPASTYGAHAWSF